MRIPQRVYEELGGDPAAEEYPSGNIPYPDGFEEGWIIVDSSLLSKIASISRRCHVVLLLAKDGCASENANIQQRRKQLVATLGNAQYRLESNENLDSVPILTIENVCPRVPFEYLLTEESDVAKFEKARADLQRKQPEGVEVPSVQFTVDLGHAPNPLAILDAVGCPAHVHLHGSLPITKTNPPQSIRDKCGIGDDALRGLEEPPGEIQHLPPQDGQHNLERMIDTLDSSGYSSPVVLELAPPFRTSETLRKAVDALRTAGW